MRTTSSAYPSGRLPRSSSATPWPPPVRAQAGPRMPPQGGHAADAAAAAGAAMTLCEPVGHGHGGDAFGILWGGQQLQGLNASGFDLAGLGADGLDATHLRIEALEPAFADVYPYLAEPSRMAVTPVQMLDETCLRQRAKLICMDRAQDFAAGNPARGGALCLTAADENGMEVNAFGSGPASPNAVATGRRPFHTTIPGGRPAGHELRRGGGPHAAPGHVQTLVRGHRTEVIHDDYQDVGAGQFIGRIGDPKVEGCQCAGERRRDGLVAGC